MATSAAAGVAMAATVASTFGWFQIKGKGVGLLAASVADNAGLYTTAGAGDCWCYCYLGSLKSSALVLLLPLAARLRTLTLNSTIPCADFRLELKQ